MKPIYLRLTNIGPFHGRAEVDFGSFSDNALFLITGRTGSGKSFLFDSMCYALYGNTPSGREKNLVSDLSELGEIPSIELGFQVGEDIYHVNRLLEYEDQKSRGSGTTIRGEKQSLLHINHPSGKKKVLAKKKREVNEECARIIGLDMDQFSRVMLIPQGEFRELLKASTEDRENLLSKLFNSTLYADISKGIEDLYKKRYKQHERLIERGNTLIKSVISKIPDNVLEDVVEPEREHVIRGKAELESGLLPLEKRSDEVRSELKQARKEEASLKEILRTQSELKIKKEQCLRLEETEKKRISPMRDILKKHRLGFALKGLLDNIQRLENEMTTLDRDIGNGISKIELLKERFVALDALSKDKVPSLEEEKKKASESMRSLEKCRDPLSKLGLIRDKERRLSGEIAESKGVSENFKIEHEGYKEKLSVLVPKIDSIEIDPEEISSLDDRIKTSRDLMGILRSLSRVGEKLEDKKSLILECRKKAKSKSTELDSMRELRERCLAGELAMKLKPGDRCPVCGSKEHEKKAELPADAVGKDEINEKAKEVEDLRNDLEDLKRIYARFEEERDGLKRRVKEIESSYPSLSGLEEGAIGSLLKDLQSRRDELNRLVSERRGLNEERAELERLRDESREKLDRANERFNEISEKFKITTVEREGQERLVKKELPSDLSSLDYSELENRIPDKLASLSKVVSEADKEIANIRENRSEVDKEITTLEDRLEDWKKRRSALREELNGSKEKLDSRMKTEQYLIFRNVSDLENSILPGESAEEKERIISGFEKDLSESRGSEKALREKLRSLLGEDEPPTQNDMEKATGRVEDLERRADEVLKEITSLRDDISQIDYVIGELDNIEGETGEIKTDMEVLRPLNFQVKGQGRPKISLERFFLAQRFEEVLLEANYRLRELSQGRFTLKRTVDYGGSGGKKVGLDLNVVDNHTGVERPAITLSGGQMFLASLSLALGLADVVQKRSGGVRMDALFIDEGFGSLDEETLQLALKVLSELRKGRMVGVISHVQELRRQIRERIEITAGRDGSSLRMVSV